MAHTREASEPKPPTASGPPRIDPLVQANFHLGVASLFPPILVVALIFLDESDTMFHGFLYGSAAEGLFFLMFLLAIFLPALVLVLLPVSIWRIWKGAGRIAGKRQLLLVCSASFVGFFIFFSEVPNLLHTDKHLHVPTSHLRNLNRALATYASTYNQGFPDSLNKLGAPLPGQQPDANHADLVDPVLAGGAGGGTPTSFVKSQCKFSYTPGLRNAQGHITTYTITARPMKYAHIRGNYFTDESAVIRGTREDRAATAQDPPL